MKFAQNLKFSSDLNKNISSLNYETIQLHHFESYFLFLECFLFKDFNKRKKSNYGKIENMIQSDAIELRHFVSRFWLKIFFQKVLNQILRKLNVLC